MLQFALSVLTLLTFGTIMPLAYATPPDQTWIGGFYDHADYDDVIFAIMGVDGAPDGGGPAFLPWTPIAQRHPSSRPVSITSHSPLTLADRSPPLHETLSVVSIVQCR